MPTIPELCFSVDFMFVFRVHATRSFMSSALLLMIRIRWCHETDDRLTLSRINGTWEIIRQGSRDRDGFKTVTSRILVRCVILGVNRYRCFQTAQRCNNHAA